nr:DciA family protein [Kushneria indalinina]
MLRTRGSLAPLIHTAGVLLEAQEHLLKTLPDELSDHVRVGGYHDGNLTLMTDRAVWLTWLRFERQRLLTLLRQLPAFHDLSGLTFKVRPIKPVYTPHPRTRELPETAASQLRECARDTTSPRLRKSLERLASHAGQDSE